MRYLVSMALLFGVVIAALMLLPLSPKASSVDSSLSTSDAAAPDPGVPSARDALTKTSVFLPLISRGYWPRSACSPESPFGVEIAALQQVEPGGHLTEAEWLRTLDAAFPSLVNALKSSGACSVRVPVRWAWIQPDPPPAPYVWGPYHDEKLALLAETGVQLIAHVDDVPTWAADTDRGPIAGDRLADLAQFLTALVNRYKQPPYNMHTWELFNEPDWTSIDGTSGWGQQAIAYRAMLAVAYPAIKAADPTATVLLGGMAYDAFTEYGGNFYRYFIDDLMTAGGAPDLDAVNVHYFPDFAAEWERWTQDGARPTCGLVEDGVGLPYDAWGIDIIAKARHLRNRLLTCFDVDKPMWLTEIGEHGYPDQPETLDQQARYVVQGLVRALAAGIDKVSWYALVSPPGDPYEQGLLYSDDWSPKPAFLTYQVLTYALDGYQFGYTREISGAEAYVFRDALGREKTVAWAAGPPLRPAALTIAGTGRVQMVDRRGHGTVIFDGGPGDLDGVANLSITLELPAPPEDPDPNPPRLTAEPLIISP